jgi:plastocyanin
MGPSNRFVKLGAVGALVAGVFAAGILGGRGRTLAQDKPTPQTYMVEVGASGGGNIDVLAFAPSNLKVHRGDTVVFHVNGFHNVHFQPEPIQAVIAPEVDGKPVPQLNPAAAFPTIKDGDVFKGGDANIGMPGPDTPTVVSITIDAEPGSYNFYCDIHPGMAGMIEVVPDDQAIPGPVEVANAAHDEMGKQIGAGTEGLMKGMAMEGEMKDGAAQVSVSVGDTARSSVNQFFPAVVTIKAGESVTFTVPADGIEPHLVNWPALDGSQDFVPVPQKNGPPMIVVGPNLLGSTQSGAEIKAGGTFNSGLLNPGQSFTLKFTEPGVYRYVCNIHPGMQGVIVVE